MDWLSSFVLIILGIMLVQILIILMSDCDLMLKWAEVFGHSTGTLKGKVVWITGASSGIGEALALELAKAGCKLIVSARRLDRLNALKDRCVDIIGIPSDDILVVPLDLLETEAHAKSIITVLKHFKQIHILVNNAGRSQRALWESTDLEVDRQMLNLNVIGQLSITKQVLPHMIENKSGHIVITSSVAGRIGVPGLGSYSGAKHALHGWFNCLAKEGHEHNIKVTLACPGPVFTEALQHAFTGKTKQTLGVTSKPNEKRMSAERCARLIAISIANKRQEVWITRNPGLMFLYMFQYFPALALSIANIAGGSRVKAIQRGEEDLHQR